MSRWSRPLRVMRRILKWLGVTVVVLVLLVIVAILVLRRPGGREFLRRQILKQTRDTLPGLSLDRIEGDFTHTLAVFGVVLNDRFGGPAIRVRRVSLSYDLAPLARGLIRVERIEIDQPELQVRPSRNGELNLSQLVVPKDKPEPPSEPTKMRLDLARLQLRGGKVSVAGASGPLVVEGLDVDLGLKGGLKDALLELRRLAATGIRLPDGRRLQATLSGRAAIDPERFEARFAARAKGLTPSGELALDLSAKGPHARVRLDLRLDLAGHGVASIDGWAGIDRENRPSYALRTKLSGIDPDELVPALRPTRLGLQLDAQGEGVPLQPKSASKVTLRMPPATVRGFRIGGLTLRAGTKDGHWALRQLKVKAAGGEVSLSGEGTRDRVDATAHVDLPALDRLPAEVRQLGVPRLSGSVKVSTRVTGPVKGPLAVQSTVRLEKIAVAALRLKRAELSAKFAGLPTAPDGKLKLLALGFDPGNPRWRLDRAELEVTGGRAKAALESRLHINTAIRGPAVRARLAADTAIANDGKRIEAWLRRLELDGMGLRVKLLNQPHFAFHQGSRVEMGPTRLGLLDGEVVASGLFRFRGFPRLVASVEVNDVKPPGFSHPVQARLQARAERKDLQATLEAKLPSLGSRLDLAARLPVRYRSAAPAPDLGREGELKLRANGFKLALLKELQPALPPVSGDLDLALDASGPLKDPRVRLAVKLAGAGFGNIHGVSSTTEINVADGKTRLRHRASLAGRQLVQLDAAVPIGLAPVLQGKVNLESHRELPVELHLDVPPTAISSLPRFHPMLKRLAGVVSTRVDVKGPLLRPTVELQTRLGAGGLDKMKLGDIEVRGQVMVGSNDIRAKIDMTRDRQTVLAADARAGLRLESLLQRSTVLRTVDRSLDSPRGLRPPTALPPTAGPSGHGPRGQSPEEAKKPFPPLPIDVVARLPGYPLDRLASINARLSGVRGTLSGKVHVWGNSQSPAGRAELKVGQLAYSQVSAGELALGASFDGKQLDASFGLRQPGGGQLRGGARLPLLPGQDIQGFVRGQQLDLSFLPQLTPTVREAGGKLGMDVKLAGGLSRPPVVTGHVALEQGKLRVSGVSLLHHLELRIDLEPERVRLSKLTLQGDRGQLEATGQVDLSGRGIALGKGPPVRRASLITRAKKFGLDAGGVTGVVFSGAVKVEAEPKEHTLALNVAVENGVIKMPKLEGQRQTHSTSLPREVVFVDKKSRAAAAKKKGRAAAPLRLRLDFKADPLFVRGEELDLELANNLQVRIDSKGRPRLKGKVEIRRGRIRALGNKFEVRRATVSFSGEVNPDPALDILLERAAPEATVLVQLTGTARAPELSLRSDPPIYDQSQIISLLLTGRVDSRPDSGGGGDPTMAIASAVSQALLGGILRRVMPRVGIDVARVNLDQTKDQKTGESQLRAEAEVGKYLTERLYVGYRRVFGASAMENTNEGLMEYRISARWMLMTLFGDAGVGGVDLLWNFRH